MHSKIFQFSENPVDKDDYFGSDRYYSSDSYCGNFVGMIADYVTDLSDKDEVSNIEWLGKCEGITTDPVNRTVRVENKFKYFIEQYEEYVDKLQKITEVSLGEFCTTKYQWDARSVFDILNDEFGFYMDNDDFGGPITLDEWVRTVPEGKTYYIGAVLDYHF